METLSFFRNIRAVIMEELEKAEDEIIIAMAWFTNHDIFDVLLKKLEQKVKINLVILNDDINNRADGLDFQAFIDKGGCFYYGSFETPMHNKYCIIDNKTLITGSYNYTYLAESINEENVIKISGACDIINLYVNNFKNEIIHNKQPVNSIFDYLRLYPFTKNVFSFNNYGTKDIYQYAVELKKQGNENKAKEIICALELRTESDIITSDNFIIRNVVYRQWKQDYYADQIRVDKNHIVIRYRTFLNTGSWIHAPKTNHCWRIRNSENHSEYTKSNMITNIRVNGKIVILEAEEEVIYYFTKNKQDKIDCNTDLGYERNDKNILVKDNGVEVKIEKILVTDNVELSCEIHFDSDNLQNETIDLIEGFGTENQENHWHCFEINMKLNREKS